MALKKSVFLLPNDTEKIYVNSLLPKEKFPEENQFFVDFQMLPQNRIFEGRCSEVVLWTDYELRYSTIKPRVRLCFCREKFKTMVASHQKRSFWCDGKVFEGHDMRIEVHHSPTIKVTIHKESPGVYIFRVVPALTRSVPTLLSIVSAMFSDEVLHQASLMFGYHIGHTETYYKTVRAEWDNFYNDSDDSDNHYYLNTCKETCIPGRARAKSFCDDDDDGLP